MKFGYMFRHGVTYEGMLEQLKHAEELGFHSAYITDHVFDLGGEERNPFLEATTSLAAVGVQTSRIRLGLLAIFNGLRNPGYLAKTVSSLDNLLKGRFDTILGAGWNEKEYTYYDLQGRGKGMPSAGRRVDLMVETIQILRGMFRDSEFSYEGKYWKIKNAYNYPLPVQQPMPIIVGGNLPRMVRTAAKLGDGVNVLTVGSGLKNLSDARDALLPALKKNGKSLDGFRFGAYDHRVWHYKSQEAYEEGARVEAQRLRKPVEDVKRLMFIGTSEVLVDKLRQAGDLGLSEMIVFIRPKSNVEEQNANMTRFRDEVIKQL